MSHLPLFESALSTLYGPVDAASLPSPETWTPPERSGGHKGRYLWTDAFGVLNLLTLHREYTRLNHASNTAKGGDIYLTLAARLISTVHEVLGRTRDGRSRLPGASDSNPLGGGLRIGKIDADGPDGDGQYHHYLTLWMFALNRMSVASGDRKYNEQAISLAKAIHAPFFVNRGSGKPRMVWKMSMDLDEALVGSEGNLDPIDGFVVFRLLQATQKHFGITTATGEAEAGGDDDVLREEINDYRRVMDRKGHHFVSSDPLDLGMTLWTMHWVTNERWTQEIVERCFERVYDLLETSQQLSRNPKYRLAFREFGMALGIKCMAAQDPEKERSIDLRSYADQILESWETAMEVSLGDEKRDTTPESLRAITRVMFATALIPGAFQRGYFGPEPRL